MLNRVAHELSGATNLLLAFSGGMDSTVLLHLLLQLQGQFSSLRVVHIHHGVDAEDEQVAQFCLRSCQGWQIACDTIRIQVECRSRVSLQDAARKARYEALAAYMRPGEWLVTAHHLNDQCETFLLALKRGSGPKGLSAMASSQSFSVGQLIRPLLKVAQSDLQEYAKSHSLQWFEERSNQTLRFDRNFLTQMIIPQLLDRWPAFLESTARSAQLCAQQEQVVDEWSYAYLRPILDQQKSLPIAPLIELSIAHRNAILLRWCRMVGAPAPSHQAILHLWHEVALSRHDANPILQIGSWQVRRFRERLYLLPPQPPLPDKICWDLTADLQLPADLGILACSASEGSHVRAPTADQIVTIRFGLRGRVAISNVGRARVKKIYQECQVPPWLRDRLPVVYYDEIPISIPGILVTAEATPTTGESGFYLEWRHSWELHSSI